MGRKIFVSYKYADNLVRRIPSVGIDTRARDYVTSLQAILDEEDHINKGEDDGEDLSDFKEETIASKLRDKIYDSTLTIVMISKGMKEVFVPESDQWIPWEVSYSLREQSRSGRTKRANALLAIVLPDDNGSYEYYITDESCPVCKCRTLNTPILFGILKGNMFNVKEPQYNDCDQHVNGSKVYVGDSSYIYSVKWDDFVADPGKYITKAYGIGDRIDFFNIVKSV